MLGGGEQAGRAAGPGGLCRVSRAGVREQQRRRVERGGAGGLLLD